MYPSSRVMYPSPRVMYRSGVSGALVSDTGYEYGIQNTECVSKLNYKILNTQYAIRNTQYAIRNTGCTRVPKVSTHKYGIRSTDYDKGTQSEHTQIRNTLPCPHAHMMLIQIHNT